jgi:N-carbamoylputrescine amidase
MSRRVITAGIQLAACADVDKNLKKASGLIELAAGQGAKIIILPQLFNSVWFAHSIDKLNFSLAESAQGPTITLLRELAGKAGVVIVAPIFEKDSGEYFNTAFVIGPGGEMLGKYRKMHVPQIPLWEERAYFKPGDLGFPVFETPFGTIGVQICWDVFFPEGARVLALKGAEIVFVPTASAFYHSRKKWERMISASAHANGVFIFRVNRVGKESRQEFYGRSFSVRPDGEFLTKPAGQSEGVVLADMDLSEIGTTRGEWMFLKDRRPEFYKEIAGREE